MALSIGDLAPNFSLLNSDNNQVVSLEDYKGKKVIVLFFPLAFTGVCTEEMCTMRDGISFYNDLNAEVLGISVDSPFTLAKFKAEQKLNFTLLSDFNKEAAQAYGSFYDEFVLGLKGVAKRSAFVIDEEGKLSYAEVLESAGDQPNYEAIKAAVGA